MAVLVPTWELSKVIGRRVEMDADTVGELLDKATARFGDEFTRSTKTALIVVNGISINTLQGRKTKLTATDEVWFLKPAGGG